MSVAQFIDKLLGQVTTEGEQAQVRRLFELGFTKLYCLQHAPVSKLNELLNDGVPVSLNKFYPERLYKLENASVAQLKRTIELDHPVKKSSSNALSHNVLRSIHAQARTLQMLLQQCQLDNDYRVEQLPAIEQYVETIVDGLNALLQHSNTDISQKLTRVLEIPQGAIRGIGL
jgi:hypothetical protein